MQLISLHCSGCDKVVYRTKQRVNESKKHNWKVFCSPICRNKARTKQQTCICANPKCNKIFTRIPSHVNKDAKPYCSRTCAVTVNNALHPRKKILLKTCLNCYRTFTSREKYCSRTCKAQAQTISSEELIGRIKRFYEVYGRIPVKREFMQTKAAMLRFGSWNNAIEASGFRPNPIKFANKHLAKDGHKCDSFAERIIDDWLYKRNITHEKNFPYGKGNMTVDFKVGDIYIEFIGLQGVIKRYDENLMKKEMFWKEKQLHVIKIYPKDLFPKSRLDEIFSSL